MHQRGFFFKKHDYLLHLTTIDTPYDYRHSLRYRLAITAPMNVILALLVDFTHIPHSANLLFILPHEILFLVILWFVRFNLCCRTGYIGLAALNQIWFFLE